MTPMVLTPGTSFWISSSAGFGGCLSEVPVMLASGF